MSSLNLSTRPVKGRRIAALALFLFVIIIIIFFNLTASDLTMTSLPFV